MSIPTIVVGGCLYYLIISLMAEEALFPDLIAEVIVPVVHQINFVIFVTLPIILILLVAWAVYLSRKVLAPLERLEEDLVRIDQGDYSVRLEIEEDHDLRPVADVVNRLLDKIGPPGREG